MCDSTWGFKALAVEACCLLIVKSSRNLSLLLPGLHPVVKGAALFLFSGRRWKFLLCLRADTHFFVAFRELKCGCTFSKWVETDTLEKNTVILDEELFIQTWECIVSTPSDELWVFAGRFHAVCLSCGCCGCRLYGVSKAGFSPPPPPSPSFSLTDSYLDNRSLMFSFWGLKCAPTQQTLCLVWCFYWGDFLALGGEVASAVEKPNSSIFLHQISILSNPWLNLPK